MTKQKITVYRGAFVHSESVSKLEYVTQANIGVDASGTIRFVDRTDKSAVQSAVENGYEEGDVDVVDRAGSGTSFFFPGFFDTHIHAPQYPNSSFFGDSTLLDWLEKYTFPLEASLEDVVRAKEVYAKVIARTLKNGTTTASYYATLHPEPTKVLANEALAQKQRAFVGRACMVQNSPDYYCHHSHEESHEADRTVIEHINKIDPTNEIVSAIVTPRFAPSCDEKMLKWLGELAKKEQLPIQTHISENKNEIAWVKELFPQYEGYADVYDKTGLLNHKTILAHAVHLTEEEKDLVKLREAGISHCPISNSCLTSGQAPVRSMLDKGIKVSLGTDVSGGFSPSILEVARQAIIVSRHVAMFSEQNRDKLTVDEVFYLATLGGAHVCNLGHKLGNFEVGKKFDAQFVDLHVEDSPIDSFEWHSENSVEAKLKHAIQKWLFNGDDRNTRSVWVNGDLVVSK
ncbi:probable guanine deaminase [Trichomonascus vanleenenianus]|uniref:guanine deaminase n=1 Tax=Trichomonascus vanleenenianus TaxID=2268995 RepID=UPI003EC9728A